MQKRNFCQDYKMFDLEKLKAELYSNSDRTEKHIVILAPMKLLLVHLLSDVIIIYA